MLDILGSLYIVVVTVLILEATLASWIGAPIFTILEIVELLTKMCVFKLIVKTDLLSVRKLKKFVGGNRFYEMSLNQLVGCKLI